MEFTVTPELIAAIIGALISVLFSYFPKLNTLFAALAENQKKLIMLGLMVLVSGVIYLGDCVLNWWVTDLVCGQEGLWRLATILISSIVGNQGVFSLTPQTTSVRLAKTD